MANEAVGVSRVCGLQDTRPLYLAGFRLLVVGSAACAFAPSIGVRIATRVFQELGTAMLTFGPPTI